MEVQDSQLAVNADIAKSLNGLEELRGQAELDCSPPDFHRPEPRCERTRRPSSATHLSLFPIDDVSELIELRSPEQRACRATPR
jgi:hypothetical protein